ncbi:hypothetical protein [Proteiniclasticum sp.]|uniref:hypothetical protein n=1 Tax=Proteiniclasticum sp. TaxID=2053595 RepID=UPI00289E6557|nr:hypothetical protein [Proteiniclasticum sp.]
MRTKEKSPCQGPKVFLQDHYTTGGGKLNQNLTVEKAAELERHLNDLILQKALLRMRIGKIDAEIQNIRFQLYPREEDK